MGELAMVSDFEIEPDSQKESLRVEEFKEGGKLPKFSLDELINKWKYQIVLVAVGVIMTVLGALYFKVGVYESKSKIEVLEASSESEKSTQEVVVEVAGAVVKPGVYKLPSNSRVGDLLQIAGGLTESVDRVWVDKRINRAAKLTDGQKLYIPVAGDTSQQSDVLSARNSSNGSTTLSDTEMPDSNYINVNDATQKQLEELPGIGPVYAQSIIEHRPYSTTSELVSKGALKQFVYDKIKDRVSVY